MAKNLTPEQLQRLTRILTWIRPDFLSCDDCLEQMERFAEMILDGVNAAEALPLVDDHLNNCGDCREELALLLAALRAIGRSNGHVHG